MGLAVVFPLEHDESPFGYYRRLSAENDLLHWHNLAALADVSRSPSGLIGQPEQVARRLGLDPAWTMSAKQLDNQIQAFGRLRRTLYDASCPRCLGESKHLRVQWEHRYVTACVRHRIRLVDSCDGCGEALSADRHLFNECQNCGRLVSEIEVERAPLHELWLSGLLSCNGAAVKAMPALDALPDPAPLSLLVSTLCHGYRGYIEQVRRNAAPPKRVADAVEFLAPLEQLIHDWPAGFRGHVESRLQARPTQARTLGGALGLWYQRVKRACVTGPLKVFLDQITEVASQKFPGVIGLDAAGAGPEAVQYLTLKESARRIGVSRDRIIDAIKRKQIDGHSRQFGSRRLAYFITRADVDRVRAERAQWVTDDKACQALGVPLAVLSSLAATGLLLTDRDWRGDLLKGGPVSKAAMAALEQRLSSAPRVPADGKPVIELCQLTSRRIGERSAIEAALQAIAEGEVQPVAEGPSTPIGRLRYRVEDIRRFFGMPVLESGLTLQQLATMTGWKYETICHWVAEGLLEAEEIKLRGQRCRIVTPVAMLRFLRTYISLTDIAQLLETKPSAVARYLHGVELHGAKQLPGGARRGGLIKLEDLVRRATHLEESEARRPHRKDGNRTPRPSRGSSNPDRADFTQALPNQGPQPPGPCGFSSDGLEIQQL